MKKLAVLGSGLLGGSMALAIQKRVPALEVCLWGRREEAIAQAKLCGVICATTDLNEAARGADCIILSTPVGAMLGIIEKIVSEISLKGVLLSDVGSVKLTPRDTLEKIVKEVGANYIGSHPMAGSEQAGILAAREDLFEGAACVLTNDFHCAESEVAKLRGLWESLGCECFLSDSGEHDRVMARISHFPHLLASVGAVVGMKHREDGQFAGNGMRDTTRVASGHPAMWGEILIRNKKSLKAPIEEAIEALQEVLALLEKNDEVGMIQFLEKAKFSRDQL